MKPGLLIANQPSRGDAKRQKRWEDRRRGTRQARGYDRDWERLRARKLRADPLCEACKVFGKLTDAHTVHHIQPIAKRPDLRLEMSNLQSLCSPCHDSLEHGFIRNPVPRHGCDEHGNPLGDSAWNQT